ncbi:MAG: hypothetical protein M3307_02325 [Thermoproteota archaeon]|nr:hypothetical protein [Thermoproteota archaeon]
MATAQAAEATHVQSIREQIRGEIQQAITILKQSLQPGSGGGCDPGICG